MIIHFDRWFETTFPGTDLVIDFQAKGTFDTKHFGNDPDCATEIELGDVELAGENLDPWTIQFARGDKWVTLGNHLMDLVLEEVQHD
jgi:hypothetical protein